MGKVALLTTTVAGIKRDKLLRTFDGERFDQYSINQTKDRCVGSNAKRK
jgi:hypothetical protein